MSGDVDDVVFHAEIAVEFEVGITRHIAEGSSANPEILDVVASCRIVVGVVVGDVV